MKEKITIIISLIIFVNMCSCDWWEDYKNNFIEGSKILYKRAKGNIAVYKDTVISGVKFYKRNFVKGCKVVKERSTILYKKIKTAVRNYKNDFIGGSKILYERVKGNLTVYYYTAKQGANKIIKYCIKIRNKKLYIEFRLKELIYKALSPYINRRDFELIWCYMRIVIKSILRYSFKFSLKQLIYNIIRKYRLSISRRVYNILWYLLQNIARCNIQDIIFVLLI